MIDLVISILKFIVAAAIALGVVAIALSFGAVIYDTFVAIVETSDEPENK